MKKRKVEIVLPGFTKDSEVIKVSHFGKNATFEKTTGGIVVYSGKLEIEYRKSPGDTVTKIDADTRVRS